MENRTMIPTDFLEIIRRRKWCLFGPAAILIALAVTIAFTLPRVYRSEAMIFIEDQEVPSEFVASTVTSYAEERIQTINQRIMSFTPLLKIIQEYDLYPELRDKRTTEEIVDQMRADTILAPVSMDVIDRRTGRPTTATLAFTLSYEGKNPQKVQQVANVLASLFLEENVKDRVKKVEETSSFLETEIARLKKDLSTLDSKISEFKRQHIDSLPEMLPVNLQSLNNIDRNLEIARQELRSLKEREGYLQTQLVSVNPYIDNESRSRLEELKLQLVALTKRFSEEYPDVKKARAEIAELEKKMSLNDRTGRGYPTNPAYITLDAQLASVQADILSLKNQIERMEAEKGVHKKRIAATPAVEEEYNNLFASHKNTQAKYSDLMAKLMEARVAHGLEKEQKGERFTLVEAPRLPERPYKPNRMAIILIGIILGCGAGIGLTSLMEFLDDKIYSIEQLATALPFPVIGGIPDIRTRKDKARAVRKKIAVAFGMILLAAGAIAAFHFTIMDLNVFWARLLRRI